MEYSLEDGHPFAHDPIKAIIAPRPIAWVGTRGAHGDNLAAFSFFMLISAQPLLLAFSVSPDQRTGHEAKDTLVNIEANRAFSVSIPSKRHLEQVAKTGANAPVDEFELANVFKAECVEVDAPRVADAPASVECVLDKVEHFGAARLIVGRGLRVHIDEQHIRNGRFDSEKAALLARLGYFDYTSVERVMKKTSPKYSD